MTDPMTQARQQIALQLIERAESDTAFRALLKSDPHKALRDALGVDPIPGLKINVIEEQPGEISIVLPRAIAEDELPDELLDLASGGTCFSAFVECKPIYKPAK